jgi:hypothetical protein
MGYSKQGRGGFQQGIFSKIGESFQKNRDKS